MSQQTQYWAFLHVAKALLKNIGELLFLAQYKDDTEFRVACDMQHSIKRLENRTITSVDLEELLTQATTLHGKNETSKRAISVILEDLDYLIKLQSSVKRS